MRYKVIFTSILIGVMLLASCAASQSSPLSFDSAAVEQAVRTALDNEQGDITPDMVAELDTAMVVDGQISLMKGEADRHDGQGEILSADTDRDTTQNLYGIIKDDWLTEVEVYWNDKRLEPTYTDLSGLEQLPALRRVILLAPDADTIAQVVEMPQVEWLEITLQLDQSISLPDLSKMKRLQILDIYGGNVQDAKNIATAQDLTELNLVQGVQVDDWQFLTELDNLEHLNLPSGFKDMELAEKLSGLEFFNIGNAPAQEFLDAWRNAKAVNE